MRLRLIFVLLASALTACTGLSRSGGGSEKEGPVARLWRVNAATRDFERFARQGTTLATDGALELDAAASTRAEPFPVSAEKSTPAVTGYRVGSAVLAEYPVPEAFGSAVPSLEALTPPGTWVRVTLAARVDGQDDAHGKVLTDTLVLKQPADAVRVTVWLYSTTPGVTPRVRALSLALSDKDRTPVDGPSDRVAWGTVLDVPGLSQMIYPDGGPVWCSPTSTTMVLSYWARKLGRPELAEPVPTTAANVYDEVYQGTGNWSFNTAYASARGDGALHSMVARLDSFAQVERFIAAGIPVVISIAYRKGSLTGTAGYVSDGHLIVVKGFTPNGDVICNDPAFPADDKVHVTYKREELWRAWRHSQGAVYVMWPAGTPLPAGAVAAVP